MGNLPLAPPQASDFAARYDLLFYTLTAVCGFFGIITLVAMVYFALKYKQGSNADRTGASDGSLPLEISWSILPFVLAVLFFWWGAKEFIYFKRPPKDAMQVYVVGKQWMWHFQHPESGIRENNALHLPVGVPVRLTMISQDVIHALYIPEFRVQYQVVPGRYTQVWCTPTKVGKYHLFCAMYCGTQHSEMGGYVYVMEKGDYARWVAHGGNDVQTKSLVDRGADIYTKMACANCHTDRDTIRAPSLYGLYGKTRRFDDGSTAVADDVYIRESILDPFKHIVAGYTDTMIEYKGQISEDDIFSLVAYIKSLGGLPTKNTTEAPQQGSMPNHTVIPTGPTTAVGAVGSKDLDANQLKDGALAVGAHGSRKD